MSQRLLWRVLSNTLLLIIKGILMQDLSKEKLLGRYGRKAKRTRKNPTIKVPESKLQGQMNDVLDAYHVWYIRIENRFWLWLRKQYEAKNISDDMYGTFCETFKGMPDNVCIRSISEKYNLCMAPELKTVKGKRNKDQKKWASEISVPILRTTEENEKAVIDFVAEAERLRKNRNLSEDLLEKCDC